jgi:hypothetical protein
MLLEKSQILIFSERNIQELPRLHYVATFFFEEIMHLEVKFTSDSRAFETTKGAKINYSRLKFSADSEKVFDLLPHPSFIFLNEDPRLFTATALRRLEAEIFADASETQLPTDVLAAAFFLLSRYEEYVPDLSKRDAHGRFKGMASLSARYGFLEKPIVQVWAKLLAQQLKAFFPDLEIVFPDFKFQSTFDIDMAWRYAHKGFLRNFGGFLRDLKEFNTTELHKRFEVVVLRKINSDPDFTFPYLRALHSSLDLKPIHFWLLADLATFDKNIDWRNLALQSLIREEAAHCAAVGIHPSYASNADFLKLESEIQRLEKILSSSEKPQKISLSRQHFLKIQFPETYQNLEKRSIGADFSMGYADAVGFRAGVSLPYFWFDFNKNAAGNLKVHPFAVMDVTLKNYLELTPEAAMAQINALLESVRAVGGTFYSLWHNSSVSEWAEWRGWRQVYEHLLNEAQAKENI